MALSSGSTGPRTRSSSTPMIDKNLNGFWYQEIGTSFYVGRIKNVIKFLIFPGIKAENKKCN